MKKITTILFLYIATLSFGQKTIPFADSIRNAYNIPEISYAVVDSKSTLEIAALGKHSAELPDTATLNDRFHIGSNTKAMTAFIIAKYVEKGKLNWTTRFFDLFPAWKEKVRLLTKILRCKIYFTHQAGVAPFQGEGDPKIPYFKGTNQEKRKQFGQFVLMLEPLKLDNQNPFLYSNAGYTLATLMVEKVTGKSWEHLIEKVFNKDLKLNVKLSWPENQNEGHLGTYL